MEEKIIKSLMLLGLTKTEVEVYAHLLRCKSFCSALDIAKDSGIHRSNVYDAIYSLNQKGLIKQTTDNKKKIFSAINPEHLKEMMAQKQVEVEGVVRKLKDFANSTPVKDVVYVTKGCSMIKNALADLVSHGKPIKGYGMSRVAFYVLGEGFLKEFNKQRTDSGIEMQFIYDKEIESDIKKMKVIKKNEAKFVKDLGESSTFISGNLLLIIVYTSPCTVITIEDHILARSYETYFDTLWNLIL